MEADEAKSKIDRFFKMRDEYYDGKDFHVYDAFEAGFDAIEASFELTQKLIDHIEKTKEQLDFLNELADIRIGLEGASEFQRALLLERTKRANYGRKKGSKVRDKAIAWLHLILKDEPGLSAYKLAEMLQNESESNPKLFGKEIPLSTARDYARAVKNKMKGTSTG